MFKLKLCLSCWHTVYVEVFFSKLWVWNMMIDSWGEVAWIEQVYVWSVVGCIFLPILHCLCLFGHVTYIHWALSFAWRNVVHGAMELSFLVPDWHSCQFHTCTHLRAHGHVSLTLTCGKGIVCTLLLCLLCVLLAKWGWKYPLRAP